ncbi:outer membrane porin [Pseudomonas putida]|uniref:Outer membrane porin n=1 Tax=Pseudomonas putida TaxID=303 RepID=A0A379KQK8_PSEPU|nr:OprD family outer membrane porin [Pseudomonas putida]SUD70313.1 outer membrane porin [Pseudomonas putida]
MSVRIKNVVAMSCFLPGVVCCFEALAEAKSGFFEGSSLTLDTRQWYSKEIGRRNTVYRYKTDEGPQVSHDRVAWQQGFKLGFESGYTSWPVGVGLDLAAYSVVALERDTGDAAGGSNRMLVNSDGDVQPTWSRLGVAAVKLRAAETDVKIGRHQVATPVMNFSDTRTVPASFDGLSVENSSFDGLVLKSGYFSKMAPRYAAGTEDIGLQYAMRPVTSDWTAYFGGDHTSANGLKTSVYISRIQDIWDRQYFGLAQTFQSKGLTTSVKLSMYNTKSSGKEEAGPIDQQAFGLAITPRFKNHSVEFGLQKIVGDEFFDFVKESNAIELPNTMVSYFNGPNETSFQVKYINDWAAYGVPGFKSILWHTRGWGIDGTGYDGGPKGVYTASLLQDNERHNETGLLGSYTFQSGELKGGSILAGYAWHRASSHQAEGNFDELRVILRMPFSIF